MHSRSLAAAALLLALLASGCRNVWRPPPATPHLALAASAVRNALAPVPDDCDDIATVAAREQMARLRWLAAEAARVDKHDPCAAADAHFAAALAAWEALSLPHPMPRDRDFARTVYHASLARTLAAAEDNGRLVPGVGLQVRVGGEERLIPIVMHDFAWRPSDVQAFHPVGDYRVDALSRRYHCPGWGVPVVIQRNCRTGGYREEAFLPPQAVFAATALLRAGPSGEGPIIELFDPLRPGAAADSLGTPLASDITAPFAYREASQPQLANGWIPFVSQGSTVEGLFMIEPYQPGKIPVVAVHGLLSSPMSWLDLANDLRAAPGFVDRYQLWAFRYDTGKPFLEAAARLRHDLYQAVATVDPQGQDPALGNIVLVGHSMGGLISKLQAVGSEDRLWNAIANQPLEAIRTDEQTRDDLRKLFCFEPQANVRRVILLGTPHDGSSWAKRPVGRAVASMTRPEPSRVERHAQLANDNPGVFAPALGRRIPTSIDMLNPDNPVLQAINRLPTNPCVTFHTVFGYGYGFCNPLEGQGDGVVSVDSAIDSPAASVHGVRAFHTRVHRVPETTVEVIRILNEHLTRCQTHDLPGPLTAAVPSR